MVSANLYAAIMISRNRLKLYLPHVRSNKDNLRQKFKKFQYRWVTDEKTFR